MRVNNLCTLPKFNINPKYFIIFVCAQLYNNNNIVRIYLYKHIEFHILRLRDREKLRSNSIHKCLLLFTFNQLVYISHFELSVNNICVKIL